MRSASDAVFRALQGLGPLPRKCDFNSLMEAGFLVPNDHNQ